MSWSVLECSPVRVRLQYQHSAFLERLPVFWTGMANGMAMLPKAGLFLCFVLFLVLSPFQQTAGCSQRHPVCCC